MFLHAVLCYYILFILYSSAIERRRRMFRWQREIHSTWVRYILEKLSKIIICAATKMAYFFYILPSGVWANSRCSAISICVKLKRFSSLAANDAKKVFKGSLRIILFPFSFFFPPLRTKPSAVKSFFKTLYYYINAIDVYSQG